MQQVYRISFCGMARSTCNRFRISFLYLSILLFIQVFMSNRSSANVVNIEMKDFAADNSSRDATSNESKLTSQQPSRQSAIGQYNFSEEKRLYEGKYIDYVREVLGKKFFKKSKKRKIHPVSVVLRKPNVYNDEKSNWTSIKEHPTLPAVSGEQIIAPMNNSTKNFEPTPPKHFIQSRDLTRKISNFTLEKNSENEMNELQTTNETRRIPLNISSSYSTAEGRSFSAPTDWASTGLTLHSFSAPTDWESTELTPDNEYMNITPDSSGENSRKSPKASEKETRPLQEKYKNISENIIYTAKKKAPQIVNLKIPEHLGEHKDRILNTARLERGYICRYFGFYNPDYNGSKLSAFIDSIAHQAKGYEKRTARISKPMFHAMTTFERQSFCDMHINGNVILRSMDVNYDKNVDPQAISVMDKKLVYQWKLPSETITVVRCPIERKKDKKKVRDSVYVIPLIYEEEYKSSYAFIFNDCTDCKETHANESVKLSIFSRIDINYYMEYKLSELDEIEAAANLEKKNEVKSKLNEPKTGFKKHVKVSIDEYLNNRSDVGAAMNLGKFLTSSEFHLIDKEAIMALQKHKRKNEPWMVKLAKKMFGKEKHDELLYKANFYNDANFTRAKSRFLNKK